MKSFATLTALALLCFVAAGCGETEEGTTTTTPGGDAPTAPAETGTPETADTTGEESTDVTFVAVNANCPMNKDGAADGASVEFDGKTVGFCCEKCMAAFAEKTDEEKAALVAAVTTTEEPATDDGSGS